MSKKFIKLSFIDRVNVIDKSNVRSTLEGLDIFVNLINGYILNFELIDKGIIQFDLNKMNFILIDLDMYTNIDFTEIATIIEYIGLYYNAYIEEWREETERMNKFLEEERKAIK